MPTNYTVDPFEPETVDPTNCPTCRSGIQPIDPAFGDAIEP